MKCPWCQFNNREGVVFCEECGAKLEFVCPNCGSNLPANRKFCGYCGHDLRKKEKPTQVDYSKPRSYTPHHLTMKILNSRGSIEGERKLVTVLFTDLSNYTAFCDSLDPEVVHQVMEGCFKILLDEVHKFEGTINQFTGDGIMALFGAPVAHEDHAQRACWAALSMQQSLSKYREEIAQKYDADLRMRIGINSGQVIIGSIGDDLKMDYTAIGDTINLASRMEQMAEPGSILVSENSYRITSDYFRFHSLGPLAVRGKKGPVEAYVLKGPGKCGTRIEAAMAKGLTTFVGRDKEIGILEEAYRKARSEFGQVVGIVGEAGVGKSRLVLELRQSLPEEEFIYLEGRCLPYGSSIAYLPILDLLRSYFKCKEGEPKYVIKNKIKDQVVSLGIQFETTLPAFYEVFSLEMENDLFETLKPREKRNKIFEAIRNLLIRISKDSLLILAIDDIHWIDRTSEEFIGYLIEWLARARIVLLLLYRPEYDHKWGNKSYYTKIGLDQLPPKRSVELLHSILSEGEVVPEVEELIMQKTGGNPLFMEEFTHTLLEDGSIQKKRNRYILNKSVSLTHIPDTIHGIISSRIDRLQDDIKHTMQVASVIGRDFVFPVLQKTTGLGEELKTYLLSLQQFEFIYEKRLFPELEYIFKHALIQEVAYKSLLHKKRKKIHGKIGRAIEELYGDRLEEFYEMLAHHYARSHNREKALRYLRLSGDKATRNYSLWEAFRYYREAIDALRKIGSDEKGRQEQVEVILLMASPMISLGFPEDSLELLKEAEKLSKDLGDEKSLSILYSIIGLYYSVKGDPVLGMKYTEKSYQEAQKARNVEIVGPAGFDLCSNCVRTGDFLKVVDEAPQIMELIENTKTKEETFDRGYNVYSALHAFYGYSLGFLGDFRKGKVLFERGIAFASEVQNLYSLGLLECLYGYLFVIEGNGKSAIKRFRNSIQYLEEAHIVILLGLAWAGLGLGYYYTGDLESALRYVQKGLDLQNDAGIPYHISAYYWFLSLVHFDRNDLGNARKCIDESLELSREYKERWVEGVSRTFLGRILLKEGLKNIKEVEDAILQGIKVLDELQMKPFASREYLYLGEMYAMNGEREKAIRNLKKAKKMFRQMSMDYWYSRTETSLHTIQDRM